MSTAPVSSTTETERAAASVLSDLVGGYQPKAGVYDELVDAAGQVRPHWRALIEAFAELPASERASRGTRLDRRVRETGIAYDIFADPLKPAQRWQLDLMPVLIGAGEWRWLETALKQRARLFDALLGDIYGAQSLMRANAVPPELVFSDSSYLRPGKGVLPRAGGLAFYAADLARAADGTWRVIDSHTETLAGVGFALANRMVHTHIAGDLFRECNAVRLANYFQAMQSWLTSHSGRENARIALLTPGPHHQDYFSHSYLARYLGYLLVEGSDLRTQGSQIHLKTLEGLKELDLIVRCIDGRRADPVELDPGGFEGTAGLVRVSRKSPHLIVNSVGSAVAQNRGLGAYLPELCSTLLGEDLALPDAPRCWLGSKAKREKVLANLDHFIIRQAQEGTGRPGQAALGRDARALSEQERKDLCRDIELHGERLVAEEKIGFSTAPAYDNGRLLPRAFAVRLFVARTREGYEVMPGGLAMTVDPDRAVALSAPDGHTRDVWVRSDVAQAPHVSLWRPTLETARVQRSQRVIQSRVADDLFWLGRYAERADWTMRVLRSALRRVEEDSGPANGRRASVLTLSALLEKGSAQQGKPAERPRDTEIESLCAALISRSQAPRTLERTLASLYRVAHLTRDRLSLEAWQTMSRFRPGDTWSRDLARVQPLALQDLLEEGLQSLSAFNGLMHENMTRNFGWTFLDMGRRLERAYNLSEAVLALFGTMPGEDEQSASLLLLLELADSFITYRSRYRLDPMPALVLDLLLMDETNPRSLAFQLNAISRGLEELPGGRKGGSLIEDRRIVLRLLTATRLADVEALVEDGGGALTAMMEEQIAALPELSNALSRQYFNLTGDAPHRLHPRMEPRT
jgi:uncharacterized circularly permuted ATP-grasp superfamily protein/uncharacterized alpha-E superfamily protein